MEEKQKIEQLIYDYVRAGLVDKDLEKLLSMLTDDIIGIGVGEQGMVASKQDVMEVMLNGIKEEDPAKYSVRLDRVIINQSGLSAQACAKILVEREAEGRVTRSGLMQSVSCRLEQETWKICAIHASPAELTLESVEAYPLKIAESERKRVRSELQKDMFALMGRSLSGGVIGTYNIDGQYPLYYINDSMLAYLDYTREEFETVFSDNVIYAVNEEDLDRVGKFVAAAVSGNSDYAICFRMNRRDGSVIWVEERARITVDEDGNEIIIGVFVDVTELVELKNMLENQTEELTAQAEELTAQAEELTAQAEELEAQTEELREQAEELEARNIDLAASEERFRIALDRTCNSILDYDILTGKIVHSGLTGYPEQLTINIEEIHQGLFGNCKIAEETSGVLNRLFQEIQAGSPQSVGAVKLEFEDGSMGWRRITLTSILDSAGMTVRAVGLVEDITDQRNAELACAREEQYRDALLSSAVASYVINFTKGIFESCKIHSTECVTVNERQEYDSLIDAVSGSRFSEKDRRRYMETFSRDRVIERYRAGERELNLEYACATIDECGIVWMQTRLCLMEDEITRDIKGFMYVMDITERKEKEVEMMHKLELDSLTSVYNKGAAIAHIENELKMGETQITVFLMLDVDHFKRINDTYGHPAGDKVLTKVAAVLSEMYQEEDVIGRLGGDEFGVFLHRNISIDQVKQDAEKVCDRVRRILGNEENELQLSCSIGISMHNEREMSFERLYSEADLALYKAKDNGRNGFAFYEG